MTEFSPKTDKKEENLYTTNNILSTLSKSDIRNYPMVLEHGVPSGSKYIPEKWISKFIEAMDNIRDRMYFIYHLETGLRVSDVLFGTEIGHIDWNLFRTYTYDVKKRSHRYVYFPKKIVGDLKIYFKYRQNENIKSSRLFVCSPRTVNRMLKRVAHKIGFPYAEQISSHWLRHTFIKLSRKAGRDLKFVQQNTGDTVETLLVWYSNLSEEEMQIEVETKPLYGKENVEDEKLW